MKEKLKTFLLFSLVSISILITQKLWMKLPTDFLKTITEDRPVVSTSYAISDMIAPNKYLLNFDQENHTLVYDDSKYGLWSASKTNLKQMFESKTVEFKDISYEDYIDFENDKSVIFYFPEEISSYILAKAWNIKKANDIVDTIPSISSIYIYLGKGEPFFVLTGMDKRIIIRDVNIDTELLKAEINIIESEKEYPNYYSMRERLDTDNDTYVLFKTNNLLPKVTVTNEIAIMDETQKNNLAKRFFNKEIGFIREIVEANGSTIYIYDQKVLKLNSNGTLEYFHGLEEPVKERNFYQSLSAAADFISQKTGVQKGMYLSKSEEIEIDGNDGYRLSFKYRVRGIPVILGNLQVDEYIQLDVFKDHIRNYKQYVRKDMSLTPNTAIENRPMLTSYDILDLNSETLKNRYLMNNSFEQGMEEAAQIKTVLNSIKDITLAYYDPCLKDKEERLIGVWAIRLQDRILAFDAYTGSLVYEDN
ncbi:MAG: hypothetical protein GX787_00180 [Tissierellia bacterium]|nr:hypothetical protein [Tissierellia bacterium]